MLQALNSYVLRLIHVSVNVLSVVTAVKYDKEIIMPAYTDLSILKKIGKSYVVSWCKPKN